MKIKMNERGDELCSCHGKIENGLGQEEKGTQQ